MNGHIYCITNERNQKQYVGQAQSHRKNKGTYKYFGYEGRFRDHVSEAICNTKKKQCWYLNNAIRLHGKEAFKVELLIECPLEEMDTWEHFYIAKLNTYYPDGYNLTLGGHVLEKASHAETIPTQTPAKRGGSVHRTETTRKRISEAVGKTTNSPEICLKRMKDTQHQHHERKVERFAGCTIDLDNLDKYIRTRSRSVIVTIDDKQTRFVGKHDTLDALVQRARDFLIEVATLPNCSGKP